MSNIKYTPDGLPVVSIDTMLTMQHEITKYKNNQLQGFRNFLIKENQNLVRFIDDMVEGEVGTIDFTYGLICGMQIMYESLRRQSAANKLEKEINGK